MKLQKIEIFHVNIPVTKPLVLSFGTVDRRPYLIVKMTSDTGVVGYGESSPLYYPISEDETLSQGLLMMRQQLPHFLGIDTENMDRFYTLFDRIDTCPVGRLGIEEAYLDVYRQTQGLTMQQCLSGTKKEIEIGGSIGIADIQTVLLDVGHDIASGFKRIKLKIQPGHDIDIVRHVRSVHPDIVLAVDANAAYQPSDMDHLSQLGQFDLLYIEQPFEADEYDAHAFLRQKTGTKICLDESIRGVESCQSAVESRGCDIVNIKPARIGSLRESVAIHDYCLGKDVAIFGGGRMESGIGRRWNAALYSLPGFTYASDLSDARTYLKTDILTKPFEIINGVHPVDVTGTIHEILDDKAISDHLVEHLVFDHKTASYGVGRPVLDTYPQ